MSIGGTQSTTAAIGNISGITNAVVIKADTALNQVDALLVGGNGPVGIAPVGNPISVSGVDTGGLKRELHTDTVGNLYQIDLPDITVSDTHMVLNGVVRLAVPDGYKSLSIAAINQSFTGQVSLQVSFDNAVSFMTHVAQGTAAVGAPQFVYSIISGNTNFSSYIPAGATHVQLICVSLSAGNPSVKLTISKSPAAIVGVGITALAGSNTRIGNIGTAGVWYDDTTSALTSGSSFTSTARDVTQSATAVAWANTSTYGKEYRVLAVQDVVFTLYLEVSRDNTTFRRIKQVIAAQNVTSGLYIAELRETPAWRYYRYVIVNGGTVAAHTTGGSIIIAA